MKFDHIFGMLAKSRGGSLFRFIQYPVSGADYIIVAQRRQRQNENFKFSPNISHQLCTAEQERAKVIWIQISTVWCGIYQVHPHISFLKRIKSKKCKKPLRKFRGQKSVVSWTLGAEAQMPDDEECELGLVTWDRYGIDNGWSPGIDMVWISSFG